MTKPIISLSISTGSYTFFRQKILELAPSNHSSYICIANVHMTIEAYRDSSFAEVVNNADLVTPDGMPLVKALKLLYGIKQERVAGMDLLPDILKEAEKNNLTVFFYGGTNEMLQKTKLFIDTNFPNLSNHHYYSPPFRPLTSTEEIDVINHINETGAHIVFVALGCPKQEKWMASMKGKINSCMVGVGGALPVMIGLQKRAPKWMQAWSLEWLFRLLQEPRRLLKRYLITNSIFLFLIMKQIIRTKLKLTI